MNEDRIEELSKQIDSLAMDLILPLQTSKTINHQAVSQLLSILGELEQLLATKELVSKKIVGYLWTIFTLMLAEADHAKEPDPILSEAWKIADRIDRIFGFHFPEPD